VLVEAVVHAPPAGGDRRTRDRRIAIAVGAVHVAVAVVVHQPGARLGAAAGRRAVAIAVGAVDGAVAVVVGGIATVLGRCGAARPAGPTAAASAAIGCSASAA
jgi:hypothetical protein